MMPIIPSQAAALKSWKLRAKGRNEKQ